MTWLYLIILTIAITGFFATAIGLKLVFEKDSSFRETSCGVDTTTLGDNLACSHCKVKEIDSAKEILRKRFAKGEISKQEFEQISKDLG